MMMKVYMFIEDNAIYIKSTILNTKNLKINYTFYN